MTALLTADEAARLVPGERLVIVRAGICPVCIEAGTGHDWYGPCAGWLEPPEWVALTGPCPTCDGRGTVLVIHYDQDETPVPCPDCRGRRIVPLYTECPVDYAVCDCNQCDENGHLPVGRGSIEVVPEDDGRNWRIVIDCVEVIS